MRFQVAVISEPALSISGDALSELPTLLRCCYLRSHLFDGCRFDPHVGLLHLDRLCCILLLELLVLRIVQEIQVIALRTLGMFRKIAGALQQELKSPRRDVVILIADVVEAMLDLQQARLSVQQERVDARVGLCNDFTVKGILKHQPRFGRRLGPG